MIKDPEDTKGFCPCLKLEADAWEVYYSMNGFPSLFKESVDELKPESICEAFCSEASFEAKRVFRSLCDYQEAKNFRFEVAF